MDILTHIFLPLIALYSVGEFKKKYLLLSVFAIFPDFDVFLPKLVYITPELVHGKSFDAFSSFGIAAMILFGFMYYWNWRGRHE